MTSAINLWHLNITRYMLGLGRGHYIWDSWSPVSQRDMPSVLEQGDLFGAETAPTYRPELERVRRRIDRILSDLRAEESAQDWPYGRVSFHRMVFPKLTCWLPEDEAAHLEAQFEAEMARLEAG